MPGQLNSSCTTSYALSIGLNQITIPLDSVNDSLQVEDKLFVIFNDDATSTNNVNLSYSPPTFIGKVIDIDLSSITFEFNNSESGPCAPEVGDYLMFAKNKKINTSGLKGYYLQALLENNSKNYAELYSVGTEVTESSK